MIDGPDRRVVAAREASEPAPLATFSVVVPLFDCRDAGTRALESALDQEFPRGRYEVIVVTDARARKAWPHTLLARCDHVVAVDADFHAVESEIALFDAGSRVARGDYLYFIEGHTVLATGALRAIDAHLAQEPGCDMACGRRLNHARTRLGVLIGGNNDVHEARAHRHGNFTLGANCVIRRSVFAALGGFDPRLLRFNETALYQRAVGAGVAIGAIDATLCTHHNDAGFRWLGRLLVSTGRAKARYYTGWLTAGAAAHPRHPVYRWLAAPASAMLAALPLRVAGPVIILAAMALVGRFPALAGKIYRVDIGCTDVSGYCIERGWWDNSRHAAPIDARPSAYSPLAVGPWPVEPPGDGPLSVNAERTA